MSDDPNIYPDDDWLPARSNIFVAVVAVVIWAAVAALIWFAMGLA